MKSRILDKRNVHRAFELSLALKGVFAATEVLAGVATWFVTHELVLRLVERITREELLEDPRDPVANYLFQSARDFSVSTRHFAAAYLLSHGVVKLWLIVGLLRERLFYYPLAIAVFCLFIGYQLYRFSLTHSPWLLLVTAVDVVVVALTWHEYGYLRARGRRDQLPKRSRSHR